MPISKNDTCPGNSAREYIIKHLFGILIQGENIIGISHTPAILMLKWGTGQLSLNNLKAIVNNCKGNADLRFSYLNGLKLPEAAVLVPLVNVNDEACILFEVRSKNLTKHPGEVSFPGGFMEARDLFCHETCAIREVEEEIGVEVSKEQIIGSLGRWHNRRSQVSVTAFATFIEPFDSSSVKIDSGEVEEIFLAKLIDLLDENKMERKDMVKGWPPMPFYKPDGRHLIWGFSGYVLEGLIDSIRFHCKNL